MSDIALTDRSPGGYTPMAHGRAPRACVPNGAGRPFGGPGEPSDPESPSAEDLHRWTGSLRQGGAVRWDRVHAVRASIANGTYLNSTRLDEALSQLVRDLDH